MPNKNVPLHKQNGRRGNILHKTSLTTYRRIKSWKGQIQLHAATFPYYQKATTKKPHAIKDGPQVSPPQPIFNPFIGTDLP
jgi:hypothetical protein